MTGAKIWYDHGVPTCSCGRRADVQIPDGPFLCMQCWTAHRRALNDSMAMAFSFLNHIQAEADYIVGLSNVPPRIQLPQRTYVNAPVNMSTTNNIHVGAGSQVGQVNAGTLVFLDRCVTSLNSTEALKGLADALQQFTQNVVDSQQLSADLQKEVFDLLKYIMEQMPKKDRNGTVVRAAIRGIGTAVSGASLLATHWEKLKAIFDGLLK